jgi:hypothetical protein
VAPGQATPLLDHYLFSTFKGAFGGRVRFIVSGGAPLSSHVEEYLATALCTPVFQARACLGSPCPAACMPACWTHHIAS